MELTLSRGINHDAQLLTFCA
uniref:Uncharacterized protein n=1 Tax=Arundo donax TaxID=35708 RepID=A0A0A9G931_ARUDO